MNITKNGQNVSIENEVDLIKNDVLDITYTFNPNERKFNITKTTTSNNTKEEIDLFANSVSPHLTGTGIDTTIFTNEKIKYKPRFASTNGFGWWSKFYVDQPYEKEVWESVPSSTYEITYRDGNQSEGANKIKKDVNDQFRVEYGGNTNDITTFNYKFNTPASFSSVAILGGTSPYWAWAPQKVKITGTNSTGEKIEITNGEFVSYEKDMIKTMYSDARILNLKEPVTDIVELDIEIYKEQNQHCLQLEYIDFMTNKVDSEISNIIPSNESFIKYSSGFTTEMNSIDTTNKNLSLFNNQSKVASKENETIEFKFKGNGFSIIGKQPTTDTLIDVYVDGNLLGNSVNIKGAKEKYSQTLFSWFDKDTSMKEHTVKIVTKSNNTFYFDGFGISALFNTIGRIMPM